MVMTKDKVMEAGRKTPIKTGAEYIESLRGRDLKIYLFGELVDEPVDHPVIRPSIHPSDDEKNCQADPRSGPRGTSRSLQNSTIITRQSSIRAKPRLDR